MTTAIRVKGVSKEYQLGELQGYKTLRESLISAISLKSRPRNRSDGSGGIDRIWALKDVSFEVDAGEVIGIIGHNGAGKTTLLKILSRITEPTAGEIELFGRVSSLLEVGTGFHPELTGRENIFLNGSILGMLRSEISRKFDEIIDFSGVERFLDTPMKRYSSGMQVRLAFAVAAHLDPEILLVDEVLAVGDAEFQRRCLGKMGDIASGGRTIIFVSHNMAAIENLCSRCILLSAGQMERVGAVSEIISSYLSDKSVFSGTVDLSNEERSVRGRNKILHQFRILDTENVPVPHILLGGDAIFEIQGFSQEHLTDVRMYIRIDSANGQTVAVCHTPNQHAETIRVRNRFTMRCRIRNFRIKPGLYYLYLKTAVPGELLDEAGPIAFEVTQTDVYRTGKPLAKKAGVYVPEAEWKIDTDLNPT